MTVSILDVEKIKKHLPADLAATISELPSIRDVGNPKPVSFQELIERTKGLFTPEEADAFGRRIEESCEQLDD